MGRRITDVTSPEFDALFTSFKHTAYRLETLQQYDVSYEVGALPGVPCRAAAAARLRPRTRGSSMITDATRPGRSSSASTS